MKYLKGVKWFLVAITFSTTVAAANLVIDNQSIPGSDIQSITISPSTGDIFVSTTSSYTVTRGDAEPAPPGEVAITSFSATPTVIDEGQSTQINWATENATTCVATGGAGSWPTTSASLTGSKGIVITAAGNYTFVLSCTGDSGTVQAQASVTVNQPVATPGSSCSTPPLTGRIVDWSTFWNGTAFPNPIYNNEYPEIPRRGYLALEFNTANFMDTGQMLTIETTTSSGRRLGSISQCPGDFDVADECRQIWGVGGAILWSTEGYSNSCTLLPNTTYYFNVTFTDGVDPASTDCNDDKCVTKVRVYNPSG